MPALDESLRLAGLFARTDARRPASWLMLLAAVPVAADASHAGTTSGMVALGAGALLAVGAIGNLPLRACAALGTASRAPLVWLVERVAWPAVGLVLGAALAPPCPAPPAVAASIGLAAAAATCFAVRRRGVPAADAASLALVMAGIAGAAGAIGAVQIAAPVGRPASGVAPVIAMAAWIVAGLVAAGIDWRRRAAYAWLHDSGPPRTLRLCLTAVAMASALAAMIGWLFLDPSRASLLPLLSAGWFVALAVPEAALGDGAIDPGGWRRPRVRQSLAAIVTPAAILGWPAVVAAALGAGGMTGIRAAAVTIVVLVVAAAVLAVIVWSLAVAGASAETAQAVALSVALAAALTLLIGFGLAAARPAGVADVGAQTPGIAASAAAQ
ncbi:MAG: hypothetical protein ACK52C_13125 [Planctomycetia bacterium]